MAFNFSTACVCHYLDTTLLPSAHDEYVAWSVVLGAYVPNEYVGWLMVSAVLVMLSAITCMTYVFGRYMCQCLHTGLARIELVRLYTRMFPNASRRKPLPFVLAIEGNISSGKSQFGQNIMTLPSVFTIFEKVNNKFLSMFHTDMKSHAFALQMTRAVVRLHQLEDTQHIKASVVAVDRSILGDLVFALNHVLSGNISNDQMQVYGEEMKMNNFSTLMQERRLHAMLYLHSAPHGCRERVQVRGNVDSVTKEDYLNDIDDLHFYGMLFVAMNNILPVHVTSHDHLRSPDQAERERLARGVLRGIMAGGSPVRVSFTKSTAYEFTTIDEPHKTVYIPWNNSSDLVAIGQDHLPILPANLRFHHTQSWKDAVISYMMKSYAIVFFRLPHVSEDDSMYTVFDRISNWQSFLDMIPVNTTLKNVADDVKPGHDMKQQVNKPG